MWIRFLRPSYSVDTAITLVTNDVEPSYDILTPIMRQLILMNCLLDGQSYVFTFCRGIAGIYFKNTKGGWDNYIWAKAVRGQREQNMYYLIVASIMRKPWGVHKR